MATVPQDAAKAAASPADDKVGAADATTASTAGNEATELQAQNAKLETERRELNDRLLRLAAEFENYKRRARKELDEANLRGIESVLKELLPPLDNLDRAIVATKAGSAAATAATALLEGVQLVQKQFFSALEKLHVKPIEAEGQPFDPNFHEAVQQVDNPALPPGSVATVYQRGYIHTGTNRLLRPAVVSVVRGKPDGGTASGAASDQPN
jgi:molecular chaperone GrpE